MIETVMGIIHYGIMSDVSGRLGSVTGYMRNGKNILRIATNRGKVIPTPARLAQQEKIRICNEFTSAFTGTDFFKRTYPAYGHSGSGYNRITASLMNLAVSGTYPGQYLDYSKVLVARGPLPGAENATVRTENEICIFNWDDNSGTGSARSPDTVILTAYNTVTHQVIFSLEAGTRDNGTGSLDVSSFTGHQIALWISFINEKGDVADSVFVGYEEV